MKKKEEKESMIIVLRKFAYDMELGRQVFIPVSTLKAAANMIEEGIDYEKENTPNGYVAGVRWDQIGKNPPEGPLKYLAVIDSFEKEIMLILLSFAVSMNLYYISDEVLRDDDG